MKKFQILFLSIVLIFTACRKDKEILGEEFVPTGGSELVTSRLTGQVIDQAGLPVEDAIVTFEQLVTATNEDGVFTFEVMDLESDGQVIAVEKSGFFTNFKKIIPIRNQTFQRIGLVEKSAPTGQFMATVGGTVAKPNGEKITFQPNSIRSETTDDYQGEVTVYTHHFNPELQYFGETMPGDLSAINKSGEAVQLETFSMILVELYGAAGEKLNLKLNTTATVEFPIKGDAANAAPPTISLWSLDENTGTWVEELKATKQGDFYVGEVAHFSFWNCDAPFEFVHLEGTVVDTDGNPIPHIMVMLEIVNGGEVRVSNTNSEGRFSGGIPKDEELILRIFSFCGTEIYAENIGPFTSNQVITITVDQIQNSFSIIGTVKDCAGEPVETGYVVSRQNTGLIEIIPIEMDGNFSYQVSACQGSDLVVYGVDQQTLQKSPEVTVVNSGQTSEDVGELVACGAVVDEYFSVAKNGDQIIFYDDQIWTRIENGVFTVRVQPPFPNPNGIEGFGRFSIPDPVLGTNLISSVLMIPAIGGSLSCDEDPGTDPCLGNFNVELTRYDAFTEGFVEGIATGELWGNNQLVSVRIEFRVKVDQVVSNYSGVIWDDLNENGIRESNESGVEGVELLYTFEWSDGTQSQDVGTTDSNGNYEILLSELNIGTLKIMSLPTGYTVTLENQGMDESVDSDFLQNAIGEYEIIFPIQDLTLPNLIDCGIHLQ